MPTETFNPKFPAYTPMQKLNFIGAVKRYFDRFTENCSEETKNTYVRIYNNRIFPVIKPGLPVTSYDEPALDGLFDIIGRKYDVRETTITSTYHHLLTDPFDEYYKEVSDTCPGQANPFWGAGYRFLLKSSDDTGSPLIRIPKSLDEKQEKTATNLLLSDPYTDNGLRIGLALMLSCGVRNNEAAGFNFGDLINLTDHQDVYVLRVIRTSMINSSKRKAGGKTRNAARIIPLTKRFSDFLLARASYISSKLTFPFTDSDGTVYNSVTDLPIACRRDDYASPCSASDLTNEGRLFLKDDLKMREQDVAGISYMMRQDSETQEKDPTTYLFRRNFATHLYKLGFPMEWRQYVMGHMLEDEILKRWDFNDEEYLYKMAKLLDPIHVRVTGQDITAAVTSVRSGNGLPVEIDISRIVNHY